MKRTSGRNQKNSNEAFLGIILGIVTIGFFAFTYSDLIRNFFITENPQNQITVSSKPAIEINISEPSGNLETPGYLVNATAQGIVSIIYTCFELNGTTRLQGIVDLSQTNSTRIETDRDLKCIFEGINGFGTEQVKAVKEILVKCESKKKTENGSCEPVEINNESVD